MKCPRKCENGINVPGDDTYHDHVCSYCGSISANHFMDLVKDGCSIIPTDKDYKVYIQSHDDIHKFYFQHFNTMQQHEFVELINNKVTVFEDGNFFYVLPFFCRIPEEQI